jgi:hypothetical protein
VFCHSIQMGPLVALSQSDKSCIGQSPQPHVGSHCLLSFDASGSVLTFWSQDVKEPWNCLGEVSNSMGSFKLHLLPFGNGMRMEWRKRAQVSSGFNCSGQSKGRR